ncbi:MAG: DUF1801 domain-containing protein [Candidatus Gracilibacteria bacterium]
MSELKTIKNDMNVEDFINKIEDPRKREDSHTLLKIFEDVTGEKATMWGDSIIGFGQYHYKSEKSAQEGDWPMTGFSPRKANLTIYIMPGFEKYDDLLEKLGRFKKSKACLYINRLGQIDIEILKEIIVDSVKEMKKKYNVA